MTAMMVLESFPSRSQPGTFYEIRKGGDGKVYCTCPAWRFSRAHVCKHLKERRAKGFSEPIADPKNVVAQRAISLGKFVYDSGSSEVLQPRRIK